MFAELLNEGDQGRVFQTALNIVPFPERLSQTKPFQFYFMMPGLSFLSRFCATLDDTKEISIDHSINGSPVRKALVPHQRLSPQRQCQQSTRKRSFYLNIYSTVIETEDGKDLRTSRPSTWLYKKSGWSKTACSRHAHKTAFQVFLERSDCKHVRMKTQCKHSLQTLRKYF